MTWHRDAMRIKYRRWGLAGGSWWRVVWATSRWVGFAISRSSLTARRASKASAGEQGRAQRRLPLLLAKQYTIGRRAQQACPDGTKARCSKHGCRRRSWLWAVGCGFWDQQRVSVRLADTILGLPTALRLVSFLCSSASLLTHRTCCPFGPALQSQNASCTQLCITRGEWCEHCLASAGPGGLDYLVALW